MDLILSFILCASKSLIFLMKKIKRWGKKLLYPQSMFTTHRPLPLLCVLLQRFKVYTLPSTIWYLGIFYHFDLAYIHLFLRFPNHTLQIYFPTRTVVSLCLALSQMVLLWDSLPFQSFFSFSNAGNRNQCLFLPNKHSTIRLCP